MKKNVRSLLILLFGVTLAMCTNPGSGSGETKFNKKSELFSLTANGRSQFVEHFKTYHYANFEMEGEIKIEITSIEDITKCVVSPWVKGIESVINGKTATFTLPSAGWYLIEINETEHLAILVDKKEENVPRLSDNNVIDVRTFAQHDDELVQTEALQRAINETAAAGQILYFPAGIHRTGTLTIPSNSQIYMARGAMVIASENRDDFPSDGNRQESDGINQTTHSGEFMTFSRLILIEGENIRIWGRGTFDGTGTILRAQGKPANLIRMRNAKNVLVEGVILRDPAAWNTHILYSEDIIIRGVKVLNDFTLANTDGFDPDASKNVLIENSFAYCNDDNIAIKTTNNLDLLRDVENIVVRNCVFYTRKSSLKVGTETKGAVMRNILFENIDVIGSDRALALYANDGALFEDIRWVNIRVEKNVHDSQRRAIQFRISNRYGKSNIRNLLIKDVVFYEEFPNTSDINGLDENHTIEGIVFDNVTKAGRRVQSLEDFPIRINEFVKDIQFR
jgi:hypothetical protein